MFRFFKKKRELAKPPEWARFFSAEQYRDFVDAVTRYFDSKGVRAAISDEPGSGVIRVRGHPDFMGEMGLLNLAQACAHVEDPATWGDAVARHFDGFAQSKREQRELEEKSGDFNAVKDLLRVEIKSADAMPLHVLVYREDLPGTISYLTFDLPSCSQNVKPELPPLWGRSREELFEVALANVWMTRPSKIESLDLGDGLSVCLLAGDEFHTASHALLLPKWDGLMGRHGSLVSIPTRNVVLCYPINDLNVIRVLDKMYQLAGRIEARGPGSVSPSVYWFTEGVFTELPMRVEGERLVFTPPQPFLDLLTSLRPPGD